MIGSIRGTLLDATPRRDGQAEVLVEASGVGYRLLVSAATMAGVGPMGSAAFFYIHTHVREDTFSLFGFPMRQERNCFEALIATHGVGPSVALAILSVHSPGALYRIIEADDADALTDVPGIGKKTAARLLIELKARLDVAELGIAQVHLDGPPDGDASQARGEVRVALAGLGYSGDEIRLATRTLPTEGTPEDLLRLALRQLAANR